MSRPPMLHPAVPIGARRPYVDGFAALESRLRMVLETRPGRLPWRPDFGCDLAALVGEPATPQNIGRASFHVEQALTRWLPDVKIVRLSVEARPIRADGAGAAVGAPAGEGALASLGTHAVLSIQIDLATPWGPHHLSATVQP